MVAYTRDEARLDVLEALGLRRTVDEVDMASPASLKARDDGCTLRLLVEEDLILPTRIAEAASERPLGAKFAPSSRSSAGCGLRVENSTAASFAALATTPPAACNIKFRQD
jgi:hypothetical protein